MTARWLIEDELSDGRLVELLLGQVRQTRAIWAVLSRRGPMTPKVQSLSISFGSGWQTCRPEDLGH